MILRELKINFKSFIIYTLILIGIFTFVFLMYPTIMNSEKVEMLNETMKMFPKEILKAFNMDISNIGTAFGWVKTEGMTFVFLITGVYSGILGSTIILKEENDKTIEYLNSLPITRTKIVLNKTLVGLIYIILMVFFLAIFNFIGLSIIGDFDNKLFWLISITPLLTSIVIYSICLFISVFAHKTKNVFGISLGIVFLSYFLNIFSELGEKTENLKYFSIFTLSDIRNVILNIKIKPIMIIISIIISLVFIIATVVKYNKKELV